MHWTQSCSFMSYRLGPRFHERENITSSHHRSRESRICALVKFFMLTDLLFHTTCLLSSLLAYKQNLLLNDLMNYAYIILFTQSFLQNQVTCAYQEVRNVRFFGIFDVLCFLVISVLRFTFLPYYRPIYFRKMLHLSTA